MNGENGFKHVRHCSTHQPIVSCKESTGTGESPLWGQVSATTILISFGHHGATGSRANDEMSGKTLGVQMFLGCKSSNELETGGPQN